MSDNTLYNRIAIAELEKAFPGFFAHVEWDGGMIGYSVGKYHAGDVWQVGVRFPVTQKNGLAAIIARLRFDVDEVFAERLAA